jgi:hypothetical protein
MPISPYWISSPNVKSASEKCKLQIYSLDSFLTCCALQGMPSLSHIAESCVKIEPENIKETVISD